MTSTPAPTAAERTLSYFKMFLNAVKGADLALMDVLR
jgi:hypothetical protein